MILLFLIVPYLSDAKMGVGVNLGKIEIDEPLKPGGVYQFPSIGVINTGDEAAEYRLTVTYHEKQEQLRPAAEWFRFNPSFFRLEPGKSQNVEIALTLPLKATPGNYFAYLEAYPVIAAGPGTTVGIAAATKTYFTVKPANTLQAVLQRIKTFIQSTKPLAYVVSAVIASALLFFIVRKFFSFRIAIRKK